jgi:hypothetical protein
MSTDARYIEIDAEPRYWEDATINGQEDVNGTLTPLRFGDDWRIAINLDTGQILDWPEGCEAYIHFKVCDQGEYWLHDEKRNRIAKWKGYYVPSQILCVGDNGYGDYIIFRVGSDGVIIGWKRPLLLSVEWETIT